MKLTGPFTQILPLDGLPLKGALRDEQLRIIPNGGVLTDGGLITAIDDFDKMRKASPSAQTEEITTPQVLLPGFVDCHTHICFGGNRAKDYSMRIAGKTYLEIAQAGGGIWDTVKQTRLATEQELTNTLIQRANRHLAEGVTTIEVKSGYGLSIHEEIKQLRAIKAASGQTKAKLILDLSRGTHGAEGFDGSRKNT